MKAAEGLFVPACPQFESIPLLHDSNIVLLNILHRYGERFGYQVGRSRIWRSARTVIVVHLDLEELVVCFW
jgi:hypothetical protein